MTIDFEQQGRALLARGYTIIPIAAGQKRPAIPKWQHARLTEADLGRFAGCGVGVLPGVGEVPLTAADADIKRVDAKLSNEKFVANAPEELVEEEKEKRAAAQERRAKILEAIERLKKAS